MVSDLKKEKSYGREKYINQKSRLLFQGQSDFMIKQNIFNGYIFLEKFSSFLRSKILSFFIDNLFPTLSGT